MARETNRVSNWVLKAFEQKKSQNGNSVIINCAKSGRRKEDGSYEKSMPISVLLNGDTEWAHVDLTGKHISVSGGFSHGEYEKNGQTYLNFTIFADKVEEYVFPERNAGGGSAPKKDW